MLALVLTLILALYILGPDMFSRVVVSLFAPGRPRSKHRGEEVVRAIIISAVPVALTYLVAHYLLGHFNDINVFKNFLSGLYGDKSLEEHSEAFFAAAHTVIRLNVKYMLIPVYCLVLIVSIGLGLLIQNYGKLLRRNKDNPGISALLTWVVRPWAADWHLKLSSALLPSKSHYIRVEALTKPDTLYRGTLKEHHLAPDGSLVSLTLTAPQKFKRKDPLTVVRSVSRSKTTPADPSLDWHPIEAEIFVIMAAEVVTLSLIYVDRQSLSKKPRNLSPKGASKALAAAKKKAPLQPRTQMYGRRATDIRPTDLNA